MSLRNRIGALLHGESFSTEPSARDGFKRGVIDEGLRSVFLRQKYALGADPKIKQTNPRRWRLIDGHRSYLVKDFGDHLRITRETNSALCGIFESLLDARPRYRRSRWQAGQMGLQYRWTVRKRWVEKPDRLLINIGAGSWHVPNWRVLEYRGPWYSHYAPGFIDYPHNLAGTFPLPLADNSVHLFYCEHVIEHLRDEWCAHLFREVFRTLAPGGGFRVVMPDAGLIYRSFLQRDEAFFKSWMERDNSTIEEAFCTLVAQSRNLEKQELDRRLHTMTAHKFLDWCKQGLDYDWKRAGEHINWFDYEKLSGMLRASGFRRVERTEAQQSLFPEIRGPKFDTRGWYSLHIDCIKD